MAPCRNTGGQTNRPNCSPSPTSTSVCLIGAPGRTLTRPWHALVWHATLNT
ncbi:hypothetical protein VFPPC_15801 [Pochonia chlamydosporia 170]|uniref:Uncharacterized protein n=1 Tax=Pochonia chlamydosporia 170 TaxID=1380566 RepID=A0A179FT83_METCM|nr:hypothetical protein VFPPC_15801 [Pochonia chlamydosporia 170]OAQ68229.1 hypothetical protein VFPPC_15801 [Pochonia chlamydosporia 170]